MKTWYRPFSLLLLASMAGGTSGCAQSSGWLAKKPSRKESDRKLADAKKKSGAKAAKSTKELAELKSGETRVAKAPNKSGSKSAETDSKIAAAGDRLKRNKSLDDPFEKDMSPRVADNSKKAMPKPKPKSAITESDDDDDLDTYMAKLDKPIIPVRKATANTSSDDEFDPFDDGNTPSKKTVVQVKKEVDKSDTDPGAEGADWDDESPDSVSKSVKAARADSNLFNDDQDAPADRQASARRQSAVSDVESESSGKTGIRKAPGRGLSTLCPEAEGELSSLLKEIDSNDAESVKQGLHHIGQMGQKGLAATPLLRKMLKHEDPFVRAHAALAMARLNLTSPESVEIVISSLRSRDASLRSFGTAVLAELGPHSKPVLTNIAESLEDRDGQVRLRAAEVLIRYDDFAFQALQTLLSCLKDKNENVRWLATYSLAELAPESTEAVRDLLKASKDPAPKVRAGAVYALGEIGPFAKKQSIDELRRQLATTTDEELKSAIKYSLEQMDK